MPTLYIENIPEELFEALRGQARQHRKSIAAEVRSLLEENIPSAREIKSRQALLRRLRRVRSRQSRSRGFFPSTEEMQRRDRRR